MKASSIILAKLFEYIELKMIFELCLKQKRIMLGFFDTLQKFLGEVSLLDYLRPSVHDGARVFEAAKTGFGSSGPVGQNFLFQSFLLKDLWVPGRNCMFSKFSFKSSVVSKLPVSEFSFKRSVVSKLLVPEFSFKRSVGSELELPVPRVFF
jgi:hypothetical protein